jgi:uncharacterized membrane protein YtjA (UPF0391 family)
VKCCIPALGIVASFYNSFFKSFRSPPYRTIRPKELFLSIEGKRCFKKLFPAEVRMIRWALGFFVVALIAAILGFGGIAVAAAGIAKIIFYIFLVLFVISLLGHLANRT